MSQKLKFYFHIGQPKTGTSAIQAFLNYNREKLAKEFGILYPNFQQKELDSGFCHNNEQLFSQFHSVDDNQEFTKYLIECKQFCLDNDIDTIIISWEGFQVKLWPELIKNIESTLNCEIRLILYLRRQDLVYESSWKQWGHKNKEFQNIHDYIAANDKNYLNYLRNWLKYFPKEQFILRTFEKSCISDDVVHDFLKILGIKDNDGFIIPPDNNLNVNAGLTPEIVEILRLCNYLVVDSNNHTLLDMMYSILSEKFKKRDPFKNYGFLTLEERKKIMEKYETSNREVANIFFGDERRELFMDPIDENDVQPVFKGLTIENTVPVFMELLLHQQKTIEELKEETRKLLFSHADLTDPDFHGLTFIGIELKEFVRGTISSQQITGKKLKKDGLIFTATGNDPGFVFKIPVADRKIKALAFTLSTPGETIFQVFYCEYEDLVFSEEKSVTRALLKGKNRIIIRLPDFENIRFFRIDPGILPGCYIIHHLEIGY